jgi:hypothetical protein
MADREHRERLCPINLRFYGVFGQAEGFLGKFDLDWSSQNLTLVASQDEKMENFQQR